MSHAVTIVAVDGNTAPEKIRDAVAKQMEPFDENGKWFAEGSRWDWYVIGGRWSGFFVDSDGNEVDVIRKSDVDHDRLHDMRVESAREKYRSVMGVIGDGSLTPEQAHDLYGTEEGESEDEYVERTVPEPPALHAYAFLRDRVWHERERMGWWGAPAKTECEVDGEEVNICLHEDEETGGKVVSYGEEDREAWSEAYHERFIEPLPDNTWLVAVDYHV